MARLETAALGLYLLHATISGADHRHGVIRHRLMALAAALSFYALFAPIPLIVLIFFLLSHLVYSSDYAIVKLVILTSNLLPEISQRIMVEVYHNTQTEAAWGAVGFFILLWTITPLAAHMRSSFYLIASRQDAPPHSGIRSCGTSWQCWACCWFSSCLPQRALCWNQ